MEEIKSSAKPSDPPKPLPAKCCGRCNHWRTDRQRSANDVASAASAYAAAYAASDAAWAAACDAACDAVREYFPNLPLEE